MGCRHCLTMNMWPVLSKLSDLETSGPSSRLVKMSPFSVILSHEYLFIYDEHLLSRPKCTWLSFMEAV